MPSVLSQRLVSLMALMAMTTAQQINFYSDTSCQDYTYSWYIESSTAIPSCEGLENNSQSAIAVCGDSTCTAFNFYQNDNCAEDEGSSSLGTGISCPCYSVGDQGMSGRCIDLSPSAQDNQVYESVQFTNTETHIGGDPPAKRWIKDAMKRAAHLNKAGNSTDAN